jgi:Flp pilus assembly protein TadB
MFKTASNINKLAKNSEKRSTMSKKIHYLSINAFAILGMAMLLLSPMGILSVIIVILCFSLALFLFFRTKERDKHVKKM